MNERFKKAAQEYNEAVLEVKRSGLSPMHEQTGFPAVFFQKLPESAFNNALLFSDRWSAIKKICNDYN